MEKYNVTLVVEDKEFENEKKEKIPYTDCRLVLPGFDEIKICVKKEYKVLFDYFRKINKK